MDYRTINIENFDGVLWIKINRPINRNSINFMLLKELNCALDYVENNFLIKVIVLQGNDKFFCSGMDFKEILNGELSTTEENKSFIEKYCTLYLKTLKRFTTIPKIVISDVQGKVIAGGIGLVAASDFVIASDSAQFSLPEVLWGMIPAMVLLFLTRRIGNQEAYKLAMTSIPISAVRALDIKLIDEISNNPLLHIKRLSLRLKHIDSSSVAKLKRYFNNIGNVTESFEKLAINETIASINNQDVRRKMHNFIQFNKLPWE